MRTFTDRTAVITGAASGIGQALALELARQGARLALSDVDLPGVEETASACRALGADAKAWHLDVSDRRAVFAHADEVAAAFGDIHLVINNAGVALAATVAEQHLDDVARIIDVDLWGVINGTQAFLPRLAATGDGQLVTISSLFGLIGMPYNSAYSAAKFGVRGYTECLAMELKLAGSSVGVTCVHPGGIDTDIARNCTTVGDKQALLDDFQKLLRMPADRAARIILRGVRRRRRRVLVGADAWAMHLSQQLLGHRYQHLITAAASRVVARANR